jgi:hypothetical protein
MIGTVALSASLRPAEAGHYALTVPLSAVVRSAENADKYALMVVARQGDVEVARLRPVELGEVVGNGVAVKSGVASGDRVVITGATLLVDGDPVRIIP